MDNEQVTGAREHTGEVKQLPATIKARVHKDALSRVTRFFNATMSQILTEMLQNARRSGATLVDIRTGPDETRIQDNGMGIANPAAILSFGESDWPTSAAAEDPAGMGFYALARQRGCRIASRTTSGRAWATNLEPEHFTGEREARISVNHVEDAPAPHGTSVRFKGSTSNEDAESAAFYFPITVKYNGETLNKGRFLDNNVLDPLEWNGLLIGVHRGRSTHQSRNMNFHGLLLQDDAMPTVTTLTKSWTVSVDVGVCPELELVLPTRSGLVHNLFLDNLHEHATRRIYHAIADHAPRSEITVGVWKEGRRLGIDMPEPPAVLESWEPEGCDELSSYDRQTTAMGATNVVVVSPDLSNEDAWVLERARMLGAEGIPRLVRGEHAYSGFSWYDQLPVLSRIEIETTTEGKTSPFPKADGTAKGTHKRVDTISLLLVITAADDGVEKLQVATDAVFGDSAESNSLSRIAEDVVGLCVETAATKDATITQAEMTRLLEGAYYLGYDEDAGGDWDSQHDGFLDAAHNVATRLLVSEQTAIAELVYNLDWREIRRRLGATQSAAITVTDDGPKVRIEKRAA